MFINRFAPFPVFVSACLALFTCQQVWSLDDDRLWLPAKYRAHYFELKEAARVAEGLDRCTEVLRATLDLDLSTPDQPFYRVLCRRSDGVSYSEVVNGITMVPQSVTANEAPPETALEREQRLAQEAQLQAEAQAEAEAQAKQQQEKAAEAAHAAAREAERVAAEEAEREARQIRERERRKSVFAEVCASEIVARTSMMRSLAWVTEKPIPEELENGQMRYHAEFNAENMWGEELNYKAVCTISTPAELVVVISKR